MSTPSNIPLRGAVDLAALAQQRQAQAGGSPTAAGGVVIDVTEANFQAAVVDQSQRVPVILDLWATWCGPCKTLSPILESLAVEYGGRFVLAKVDVDAQQAIAAAFQVQSIPSVFAVLGGQPAPLFQGAMPEPQVRQYIEEVLKVAAQAGITGSVEASGAQPDEAATGSGDEIEEVSDPRYAAAYAAIEAGDWLGAQQAYQSVLDAEPGDADAQAGVALCALQARVEAATAEASDDATDQVLTQADAAAVVGEWSKAFDLIIGAIRTNFGADRDRLRSRLLELFLVAGDDPAVAAARIGLANALF